MEPIILKGKIVHGKALGRTVGMPTANLCIEEGNVPDTGVYATEIMIGGESFISVTNIGARPSVDSETHITIETYIMDFDEDIYGEDVILKVYRYLRPVMQFANLQEVQKQVQIDMQTAKKYFE